MSKYSMCVSVTTAMWVVRFIRLDNTLQTRYECTCILYRKFQMSTGDSNIYTGENFWCCHFMNSIPILSVGIIFVIVMSRTILDEHFQVTAKLSPRETSRDIFINSGMREIGIRGEESWRSPFASAFDDLGSPTTTKPPEPILPF